MGVVALKEIYNQTDREFTIWVDDGANNGTYDKLTGAGCDGDNDWHHAMVIHQHSSYVTDHCYIPWASDRNRYRVILEGRHPATWRCGGDGENKLTARPAGLWMTAAERNTVQLWDGYGHLIEQLELGEGDVDLVLAFDPADSARGYAMTMHTKNRTVSVDQVLAKLGSVIEQILPALIGAAATRSRSPTDQT